MFRIKLTVLAVALALGLLSACTGDRDETAVEEEVATATPIAATPMPTDTPLPSPTPASAPDSPLPSPIIQPESPLPVPGQFESPLAQPFPLGPEASWPDGISVFSSNLLEHFQVFSAGNDHGPVSLTADLPSAVEPVISPDGSQIAFAVYPSGPNNLHIYVMNADGSDAHPLLAEQPAFNWRPAWSPDGNQLLFVSNRDGNLEIYRANIDGTDLVNLTNADQANDADADWSPDGERIVFVSDRDYGDRAIYLMNADGSDVREIPGPECLCSYPRWSPDGQEIAFAAQHDKTWDIFIMNPDGSDIRQVTTSPLDTYMASWVGNDQLLLAGEETTSVGIDIYLINVDGTGLIQLTNTPYVEDSFPSWAP